MSGTEPAYTVERRADGALLVRGRLDFETLAGAGDTLPEALADGGRVQLQELSRIDSAGLAQLIAWRAQVDRNGGALMYEGLPRQARQMIRVYGLQALFDELPDSGDTPGER